MTAYILKRTGYSFLVVLGVLVLTFVLFRVAAGDPAAALLGKNASPREIEDVRMRLDSGKPLFWGRWVTTEAYSSAVFSEGASLPSSVALRGECVLKKGYALMRQGGMAVFKSNFTPQAGVEVTAAITFKGDLSTAGAKYSSASWRTIDLPIDAGREFTVASAGEAAISSVRFHRNQTNPWDSQLIAALREIATVKPVFPYVRFFDFGRTLVTREPIDSILWRGIGPSLALTIPIFFGDLLLSLVLAMGTAAFRGSWLDKSILIVSVASMSVSYLVYIIFAQWYLAYYCGWFPVWGWGSLKYLALPVLVGIVSGFGGGVRFYRSVFLEQLGKEYLRTAVAKGCSTFSVYFKHLLRNAMIPIITRVAAVLPFLFTGSLLLEKFFGIPGLGYAGISALENADLQLLKALVVIGSIIFVVVNLLADIAYAWADPRIRLG